MQIDILYIYTIRLINNENIKGILRTDPNKLENINKITNGKGCNVIYDCIGASEFENVILKKYYLITLNFYKL